MSDDLFADLQVTPTPQPSASPSEELFSDLSGADSPQFDPYAQEDLTRTPGNFATKALDKLDSFRRFTVTLADELLKSRNTMSPRAFADAYKTAGSEFVSPKRRIKFRDVLQDVAPEWTKDNDISADILGFIGDVALDPLTYVTGGTSEGVATGTKQVLLKAGPRAKALGKIFAEGGEHAGSLATAEEHLLHLLDLRKAGESPELLKGITKNIYETGGMKFAGQKITPSVKEAIDYIKKVGTQVGVPAALDKIAAPTNKVLRTLGLPELQKFKEIPKFFGRVFKAGYSLEDVPEEVLNKFNDAIPKATTEKLAQDQKIAKIYQGMQPKQIRETYNAAVDETSKQDLNHMFHVFGDVQKVSKGPVNRYKISVLSREEADTLGKMTLEVQDRAMAEVKKANDQLVDMMVKGQITQKALKKTILRDVSDLTDDTMAQIRAEMLDKYARDNKPLRNAFLNQMTVTANHYETYLRGKNLEQVITKAAGEKLGIKDIDKFGAAEVLAHEKFNSLDYAQLLYETLAQAKGKAMKADFNKAIRSLYGAEKIEDLPPGIIDELRNVGSYSSSVVGNNHTLNQALKGFDAVNGAFRKFATVMRLYFAPKQAVSNSLLTFAEFGRKAFGMNTPEAMKIATAIMSHDANFEYNRGARYLGDKVRSGIGERMTVHSLANELAESGLISDVNSLGDRTRQGVMDVLRRTQQIKKYISDDPETIGKVKLLSDTMSYMNWPAHVENFSKIYSYVNARMLGYGSKQAKAKTFSALFDYAHGLSHVEKEVFRRVIPFYTFQRFAGELLAKTLVRAPGRIVNTQKLADLFTTIYGKFNNNETLTPSERLAIPGFLMEQPHAFTGRDSMKRAYFSTFNNFNWLDMMNTVESDQDGDLDGHKSLQKSFLAATAPLFKVTMEMALKKDLYTDKVLYPSNDYIHGNKVQIGENVDSKTVLRNVMATIGGANLGMVGQAAGQVLGLGLGEVGADELMKKLMGWEDFTDPTTGQTKTYVSPYKMHWLTSVYPIFKSVIKSGSTSLNPRQKTMEFLLGINSYSVDLESSVKRRQNYLSDKGNDLRKDINALNLALELNPADEVEKRRDDLLKQLDKVEQEYNTLDLTQVISPEYPQ